MNSLLHFSPRQLERNSALKQKISCLLPIIMSTLVLVSTINVPVANAGRIRLTASGTIVEVRNGTADILEPHSSRPRPAKPGTVVKFGDMVRPSRGAVVVIQCGNAKREIRSISGLGNICPDTVGESRNSIKSSTSW
jgi:hypothetical protein